MDRPGRRAREGRGRIPDAVRRTRIPRGLCRGVRRPVRGAQHPCGHHPHRHVPGQRPRRGAPHDRKGRDRRRVGRRPFRRRRLERCALPRVRPGVRRRSDISGCLACGPHRDGCTACAATVGRRKRGRGSAPDGDALGRRVRRRDPDRGDVGQDRGPGRRGRRVRGRHGARCRNLPDRGRQGALPGSSRRGRRDHRQRPCGL